MKNQYFGDINDYRKYGLIRLLTGAGQLKTAVCWMLAPGDPLPAGCAGATGSQGDGRFIKHRLHS